MNHYHFRSFQPIDTGTLTGFVEMRLWVAAETIDEAKRLYETQLDTVEIRHTAILETLTDEEYNERLEQQKEFENAMNSMAAGIRDFVLRTTQHERN